MDRQELRRILEGPGGEPFIAREMEQLRQALGGADGEPFVEEVAELPLDRVETRHLRALPPGRSGWTVPWAMSIDGSRRCYLNSDYIYREASGGTVQLLVRRDEAGEYHVDISACNSYRWEKKEHTGGPWFGLPVRSLRAG